MAGLLDFNDPQQAGLLAFAQNMFAAGAPQTRRVGIGQALTSGLSGMQQAQQAAEQARRQKQEEEMMMQMKQMQFGQMQQKMQEQKATEDAMVNYAKFKQGGAMPASKIDGGEFYRAAQKYGLGTDNDSLNKIVSLVNQGGYSAESAAAALSGKNVASPSQSAQQQEQAQMPQGFSKGDLVKAQIGELVKQAQFYGSRPDAQSQMLAQQAQAQVLKLANELPKFANDYRVGRDKKGNLVNVRLGDDGSEQYSPTQVAEQLHFADNGQQLLGVDKYTGRASVVSGKYQTPDSIASNNTSMRGQNMTDTRARELNDITRQGQQTQVINDPNQGILLVDKGTGLTRKTYDQTGAPIPSESQSKKASSANNIMPLLDEASQLIGGATGSLIGAGYDATMQAFGGAPKGAQNTAKLKVIEGALMMNQPRMEGPQSDKDVALYRQMAGQLGDPTVPAPIKAAALNQIKALNEKYATNGKQTQAATGGKTIVKTGMYGGKKVYQYSDGSVDYGN